MNYSNAIFYFLVWATLNLRAQTDFLTGLAGPSKIDIRNTTLYIAESEGNKISTTDLSAVGPAVAKDFLTGVDTPLLLTIAGDFLYYLEGTTKRLYRLDLSIQGSVPSQITTLGPEDYTHMQVDAETLYFAKKTEITKLSLTDTNPQETIVLNDFTAEIPIGFLAVTGMHITGDILYYTTSYVLVNHIDEKINSVNLRQDPLVQTSYDPFVGLSVKALAGSENTLYGVTETKLARFDLAATSLTVTSIFHSYQDLTDIILLGDFAYLCASGDHKIIKLDLATLSPLSTPQFGALGLSLVANPMGDVLELTPQVPAQTPYVIYSLLGAEVQTGVINTQGNIALPSLTKGMYLLRIQNQSILRFIKR